MFQDLPNCIELVELSNIPNPKLILGQFFVERFEESLQESPLSSCAISPCQGVGGYQKNLEKSQNEFPLSGGKGVQLYKIPNLTLELGCGKGEYVVDLASKYPENNYVGIDIKGDRMAVGAKICVERKLDNAVFIRTSIENIDKFIEPNSVDSIWITFADPQPNRLHKRLTSKDFLTKYYSLLKENGTIYLKTDSELLYESTLAELSQLTDFWLIKNQSTDLHNQTKFHYENTTTTFEKKYLEQGVKIKFLEIVKLYVEL